MISVDTIMDRLLFKSQISANSKKLANLAEPVFNQAHDSQIIMHSELPVRYADGIGYLKTTNTTPVPMFSKNTLFTNFESEDGHNIGYYTYDVDFPKKEINHGYIETLSNQRHKGIGEILRLSSIMELKENNLNAIKIEALSPAVPFHLHYNFQPDVKDKDTAYKLLCDIASNNDVAEKYRKEANELRRALPEEEEPDSALEALKADFSQGKSKHIELSKSLAKKFNEFITRFVNAHQNNWDEAKFDFDRLPMVLTKEKIAKCSDFFNKLFQKHGIDYEV